jgi:hypothetical protein
MSIGLRRMGASIAAFLLAVGLNAFGATPCVDRAELAQAGRAPSITIRAPVSGAPNQNFCFEVICYAGIASVVVECNDIILPTTSSSTTDPSATGFCFRIPPGCSGSTITITAVSANGQVATTTVQVT